MNFSELKEFLDLKAQLYQSQEFIEADPIQIPHCFSKKEDIEIAGFLAATIAWGNRTSIIKNATKMMSLMDESPYDFITNHEAKDLEVFNGFVHRTFNAEDLKYFVGALQNLYKNHGGLETAMSQDAAELGVQTALHHFKKRFFELPHQIRTQKHLADPLKGSAAKRINMYLRWMVRSSSTGVDFGIWESIHSRQLSCPLDVHSGTIARKLGILDRKQNDAKAVLELDNQLRLMDAEDPVKYDFALFGLGAFEKF
ncbi:MAG: TIGR02757 family protein [Flavobacteriaceae bacterium]|nr:TIGR02757 family protein [Flavobacteriaceae bacterium]